MAFTEILRQRTSFAQNGGDTANVDISGADLLTFSVEYYAGYVAFPVVTDSESNAWTLRASYDAKGISVCNVAIFECASPITSTTYHVSLANTFGFPQGHLVALSGADAAPFDQQTGAISALQPGAILPSANNAFLLTSLCTDGGTISAPAGFDATGLILDYPGTVMGAGTATQIQTTATSVNPLWGLTAGNKTVAMASFLAATGGGGTTYTQDLTATLITAAAISRHIGKLQTAAVSPAGAMFKVSQVLKAGALTSSAAATKQGQKGLTGACTPSGTGSQQSQKPLTGAVTSSTATNRSTSRALTGSVAISATLTAIKTALLSLAATMTSSASLLKQASKVATGSLATAAAMAKSTARALAGAMTPAGSTIASRVTAQTVDGTLTAAGVMDARSQKSLTGTLAFSASVVKRTYRALSGAVAFVGTMVKVLIGLEVQKPSRISVSGTYNPVVSVQGTYRPTIAMDGVFDEAD